MHKSPHCIRDQRTNCGACRCYPSNGDSLDFRSTFKRSWINNLILYPSEHHQAEKKWFSLLCACEVSNYRTFSNPFPQTNGAWLFQGKLPLISQEMAMLYILLPAWFFSVSSNCNSDLSILMPKLLADWTQLSRKYMRQSEVRVTLWMKNKSCWRALNVYAPCVQHTKISLW